MARLRVFLSRQSRLKNDLKLLRSKKLSYPATFAIDYLYCLQKEENP